MFIEHEGSFDLEGITACKKHIRETYVNWLRLENRHERNKKTPLIRIEGEKGFAGSRDR
jgi:hypothetical protein